MEVSHVQILTSHLENTFLLPNFVLVLNILGISLRSTQKAIFFPLRFFRYSCPRARAGAGKDRATDHVYI